MNYASTRACSFALILIVVALASSADAQTGRRQQLLDPNVASEKELLALPHLTPPVVKSIIDGRPFMNMIELDAVLAKSLKRPQLTELYRRLFIHLNLNSASKEEILLIPGMGQRMLHEFEEYRPYKVLTQFRREIGKYVDEKELARLEEYVFVPIDLNSATDEDILSIPGVGKRMLHEFKEYRPYKSIEQFRREIGKYVNDRELARLERYVSLN